MKIKVSAEIVIDSSPEKIWEYAYDPENWTASNPEEHRGLVFFNESNRPATGVEFHQKEYVAGFFADLKGQILWADKPNVCVWTGVANYKFFGDLFRTRIPEGGVVHIEEAVGGFKVVHNVFMDYPDNLMGRFMYWAFKRIYKGEEAVYSHTYRELEFFKKQLE